jgi:hypothetical protein
VRRVGYVICWCRRVGAGSSKKFSSLSAIVWASFCMSIFILWCGLCCPYTIIMSPLSSSRNCLRFTL